MKAKIIAIGSMILTGVLIVTAAFMLHYHLWAHCI